MNDMKKRVISRGKKEIMLKQILNEVKGKKLITNSGVIMTKNYSLIVNVEKRGGEI